MNCKRVRELLSELLEGGDSAPVRAAREHVATCVACADELERFEDAVGALRRHGPRATDLRAKHAAMAAVDAAAGEYARADEDEFRRASLLAAARFERRARRRRVASHFVALLAGAAVVLLWLAFRPRPAAPVRIAAPPAEVVERFVEVAIPVVELRRVPYVVEVERPVVQLVDRPVEVERIVRRGPLLALDLSGLSQAVAEAARSLAAASLAVPEREPPVLARAEVPAARPGVTSVRLLHSGPSLTLETFGSLREVVPVLLSKLEDSDDEVVGLVERRLAAIRDAAASDPELAGRLRPAQGPAPTGRRSPFRAFEGGQEPPPTTPRELWTSWWEKNGALVAEAEARGSL